MSAVCLNISVACMTRSFILQVRACYPNGESVKNIEILVTQPDGLIQRNTTSDNGIAVVSINVGAPGGDIDVFVKAKDQQLGEKCNFKKFCSPCSHQITVRSGSVGKLQVKD